MTTKWPERAPLLQLVIIIQLIHGLIVLFRRLLGIWCYASSPTKNNV
jgi:hypothetical protein